MNTFTKKKRGPLMPKIIENIKEQLLVEAKKQISEQGYSATTIRSVASACGVGVGTVYNYFESKELLIATFVLESWKKHLDMMNSLVDDEPKELLQGVYDLLRQFEEENRKLFSDSEATKITSMSFSSRHKMLRSQIANIIKPMCEKKLLDDPSFTADFISEALINWSMEEVDFEMIYPLLDKIIRK